MANRKCVQFRSKALGQGSFPKEKGNITVGFNVYSLSAKGFEELRIYSPNFAVKTSMKYLVKHVLQ